MPTYKNEEKGTWYCSFYYTDWTGAKKKKKKEGFKKESEAKAFERKFLEKQQNNCDINFGALADLYMEDAATRIRATTLQCKKYIVDLKIKPYFGKMRTSDITANHVRKWQNEMIKKDYSQTYLKNINNQLSAIFNFAIKYYNLSSNPDIKAGTIGKKNADGMKFWTLDEFKKFIEYSSKPMATLAFKILFWTGIRSGELMALTWKDIDLENKILHITKTYARINKIDYINNPKTPKSKRDVSLSDFLCRDIEIYKNKVYETGSNERIFTFTKDFICREIKRICKKSEVKQIRIHDLRHSHASLLIELGFTPLLIAERLGHENPQTTIDTYSHLYPNKDSAVANKLDDLY
ncbi:tyrosine-type recombinase/integrase [Clostridium pasteurianum]|nr:site-specific integrase [Clostridium pasteurianum]